MENNKPISYMYYSCHFTSVLPEALEEYKL